MNKIYGVSFSKGTKIYYFNSNGKYDINDEVIVETEKGEQFGFVNIEVTNQEKACKYKCAKNILRKATKKDSEKYEKNSDDSLKALKKCKELVEELKLKMNFVSASYNFDRSQLIFNFYADERIDFRELAKKLASIYKTRIELRQIGARDKAKEVCGFGVCGQKLCCSRFLNQLESVSINMAKNQGIALNPNKINGVCGRLLCCLAYEDDVYTDHRKDMPRVRDNITVDGKKGVVKSVDLLNKKYIAQVENERIVVDANQNSEK